MIPAIPLGPSASQTSAISDVKRALDVVERDHPLALGARAARRCARRAPCRGRTRAAAGPCVSIT